MFHQDTEEEARFRAEVRDWLAENLPAELRFLQRSPPPAELKAWTDKLYEKGWIAPHWPKEFGGMGATLTEQIVLLEEMRDAGAPQAKAVHGLVFLGPILMAFGTQEQKDRHLPAILKGDVVWCQGYSEPNSGSDLASLQTRAVIDGDDFVINGQKIWTTLGMVADWMFALVRTDPVAPRKQAGISFVLIDLATQGITRRPITTIADEEEFAEFFFDDVRVPRANLVGELNDGWRVANAVLVHERFYSGHPRPARDALEHAAKVARSTGMIDDAGFRDRLAQLSMDVMAFEAMYAHAIGLSTAGQELGPSSSIMKIFGNEVKQSVFDLMLEAGGSLGPQRAAIDGPDGPVDASRLFLQTRRDTIRGGSNEIQRNIVARRVLDLPNR